MNPSQEDNEDDALHKMMMTRVSHNESHHACDQELLKCLQAIFSGPTADLCTAKAAAPPLP
jgi:hypothetical protein